jgi:hypothetical protein
MSPREATAQNCTEIAMTPYEYMAWFDAFTASDRRFPSLEKWALINERVADIDGLALTRMNYVDAFCEELADNALRQTLSSRVRLDRMFDGENAMRALGEVQARLFTLEPSGS